MTHASIENWEYMEIIRNAADPKCSAHLETSIETIDRLLSVPPLRNRVKSLFGVAGLEHDEDFVSLIEVAITYLSDVNSVLIVRFVMLVSAWLLAS